MAIVAVMLGLTARQVLAAPVNVPISQSGSEVSVCTWLGCKSGAVSYSQDDDGNYKHGQELPSAS